MVFPPRSVRTARRLLRARGCVAFAWAALVACGGRSDLLFGEPAVAPLEGGPADGGAAFDGPASRDAPPALDAHDAPVAADAPALRDGPELLDAPALRDAPQDGASVSGCTAVEPMTLAAGETFAVALAIDATSVYWGSGTSSGTGGLVRRVAKSGGAATTLAQPTVFPERLTTDGTSVFWYGNDTLQGMPVGGGPIVDYPIQIQPGITAQALAHDGTNLYFNDYGPVGVPKAGGAQFVLNETDFVYALAADDGGVYWVGPPRGGQTMGAFAFPAGATAPTALATAQNVDAAMALDAQWVYFIGDDVLERVPRGGGSAQVLASSAYAWAMTTDGTSVYWADGYPTKPNGFDIHRMPVGGGADTIVAHGTNYASVLAVDERCVYWTNPELGEVGVAPK